MEKDLVPFLEITYPLYHLAISTNRTNTIEPLLESFHLRRYFGKVMTAQNARRPKPAPDALEEILDHYACQAHEAVYIGDSTIDQEHAAACAVPFIAFKNPTLTAAYHVSGFMEILDLPPFLAKAQERQAVPASACLASKYHPFSPPRQPGSTSKSPLSAVCCLPGAPPAPSTDARHSLRSGRENFPGSPRNIHRL